MNRRGDRFTNKGGYMSKKEKGEAHEFFEFAESLVKQTGELALKYYGRGDPQFKFDEELVTEAELAIRKFLGTTIAERYPEHHRKFCTEYWDYLCCSDNTHHRAQPANNTKNHFYESYF